MSSFYFPNAICNLTEFNMPIILVFVFLITLPSARLQIEPKIVGGTVVKDLSTVPYQVSIQRKNNHICGGSIINENNILSAAHCFGNLKNTKNIKIAVGLLNLKEGNSKRHDIKSIIKHEGYNSDTIENDIAIIKLRKPLQFSEIVKPVELQNSSLNPGENCIISGWGSTFANGTISNNLLSAEVNIIPNSECSKRVPLRNGMICAGVPNGGKDACQGDSGGPLVCNNRLAGIVSWGIGCGEKLFPGVYTDVAYYHSWIKETIAKSNGCVFQRSKITFAIMSILYLSQTVL